MATVLEDQGEVRLVVNGGEQDREAVRLMREAGVPYQLAGPVQEEGVTPVVVCGNERYYGVGGVRAFLDARRGGA